MKVVAVKVPIQDPVDVLFIVPRFHTNYIGWLHGLSRLGISFRMLVQTIGVSENHSLLTPQKIEPNEDYFKISFLKKWKFKRFFILFMHIKRLKPKLIIFRFELSFTSLVFLVNIILSRTRLLIYLQWPLHGASYPKRFIRTFFTLILRIPTVTPVLSRNDSWIGDSRNNTVSHRSFFIPFGMPLQQSASTPIDLPSRIGSLRFLTVGKFQQRKNHMGTMECLMNNDKFRNSDSTFEIIGEVSNAEHNKVLSEIKGYVLENNLEHKFLISLNKNHSEVLKKIQECDVFILMSCAEPASISNVEAMSHGKPIIIKSGNGTANYIKDERGGFIVDSPEEFEKTLNLLFDHPDFIERSFNENLATVKELLDPESVASKLLNCAKYEVKM